MRYLKLNDNARLFPARGTRRRGITAGFGHWTIRAPYGIVIAV